MIIVVGLVIAFVLVVLFSNRRTRYCRWRAQGKTDRAQLRHYKCIACGATTTTATGKVPDVCLRKPLPPGR